ncbi:hypothetical protein SAY86_013143 [Trapa natans]|uniref:Uncharacterized protein n=1 Tax=Trapa natans TaxID=22666 RepID=A0AAN7M0U7_TRANT|nr:hypothetical protein SAY86_013143 [Trapa natans]
MMASTRMRAAKQDLPRQPSLSGSISMDDLLKNIYSDTNPPSLPAADSPSLIFHASAGGKGMDEVWKEIVASDEGDPAGHQQAADSSMGPHMTLEDFLSKSAGKRPVEVAAAGAGAVHGAPLMMMNGRLIQLLFHRGAGLSTYHAMFQQDAWRGS